MVHLQFLHSLVIYYFPHNQPINFDIFKKNLYIGMAATGTFFLVVLVHSLLDCKRKISQLVVRHQPGIVTLS